MDLKAQFNEVSDRYDSQRKILIPCFDEFYGVAIENLCLDTASPQILDLGAGTGLFSQKVLERYPEATISLVDISDKMLEVARKRLKGIPDISFEIADLTTIKTGKEQYDAVVSSLAIHHLADQDKEVLYKKIFIALKPGGIFINAEQVLADTPYLQELYSRQWSRKIESGNLSREELDAAYERVKLDKRTPLTTQLSWLKACGFDQVDCLYKYYDFSVIWAKK